MVCPYCGKRYSIPSGSDIKCACGGVFSFATLKWKLVSVREPPNSVRINNNGGKMK